MHICKQLKAGIIPAVLKNILRMQVLGKYGNKGNGGRNWGHGRSRWTLGQQR